MFQKKRKLVIATLLLLTLVCGIAVSVSADYTQDANGHLYGGEWDFTPSNLYWWSSPSVASYGYADSVADAISGWNSVPYPSPIINSASSESTANLKYYIDEYVLPAGTAGIVDFWHVYGSTVENVSTQVPGTDQRYDIATITIDHARASGAAGFGPDFRSHLLGHETGHGLGLNHFYNPTAHTGSHWMNNCGTTGCITSPSSTDSAHLQAKFDPVLP
ncbi:hypothetical protein FE784_18445 [Paenibacillus hemerocallicola]|uniref:Matrixin family metalloprotease n=1 Tax=Paenibacillus hemerocallicola TaxID=1172614 RepID=A0A5C4T8V6_9BACL|nr:hypothetical protein [Paenibacillus hemerocallicola]TNJ64827.1 hypothetical protein FE784_18445 [Paenibacillus hemerocallicola]